MELASTSIFKTWGKPVYGDPHFDVERNIGARVIMTIERQSPSLWYITSVSHQCPADPAWLALRLPRPIWRQYTRANAVSIHSTLCYQNPDLDVGLQKKPLQMSCGFEVQLMLGTIFQLTGIASLQPGQAPSAGCKLGSGHLRTSRQPARDVELRARIPFSVMRLTAGHPPRRRKREPKSVQLSAP